MFGGGLLSGNTVSVFGMQWKLNTIYYVVMAIIIILLLVVIWIVSETTTNTTAVFWMTAIAAFLIGSVLTHAVDVYRAKNKLNTVQPAAPAAAVVPAVP